MKVVTAEMMRALDRRAMSEGGIPGVVLMENAGRAVFAQLSDRFSPLPGKSFVVVCGTGNNGGDGFVVARYLKLAGALPRVALVGSPDRIQGDALAHYRILAPIGVPVETLDESRRGVVVDALLGTGAAGAPREEHARVIRWMNASRQPIISVDVPSGVDATTGAVAGEAARADVTVTFAYPKLGLYLPPGGDRVGELVVSDIGFDWDSLACDAPFETIGRPWVSGLLPARDREANKGDFGHVLVVGGSRGMSGAPTMAARAAMRAGAGLVTVAAPETAQQFIASKLDEAMTIALPENQGALCPAAVATARQAVERADVLCIGPGIGRTGGAVEFTAQLLAHTAVPTVLDADGLYALAERPTMTDGRTAPLVLTPHPGECGRLLDSDARSVQADRVAAARAVADRHKAVVVLKGASTLVVDGRDDAQTVSINTTGNPGMATGGSGDSLTGIIGALLAQGLSPRDAACAGVYVHGAAGDLAAREHGTVGMVAGDIVAALPEALRATFEC